MNRLLWIVLVSLVSPTCLAAACYEWHHSCPASCPGFAQGPWVGSPDKALQLWIDYCNSNPLGCGSGANCSPPSTCVTTGSWQFTTFPNVTPTVQIQSSNGVVIHPAIDISWRHNTLGCGVYVSATPPPRAECGSSCNSLGDPINPANGSMHSAEVDIPTRLGLLTFKRFYNSIDQNDTNGRLGPGWRHSFTRSIAPRQSSTDYQPYVVSADNSSLYSTEATACTSGFAQIKAQVSVWASASASYSNGQCRLTVGTTLIGTLPILYQSPPTPAPGTTSVIGFDATRDDGQVVSFMLDGSTIVAPAGSRLKLQQIASGFSLVDEQDNTELYDNAGRLLSITSRAGVTVSISYDGSQRVSGATSSFGNTIAFGYNANGQLESVTAPDLRTVQYAYDAQGRLESVTDTGGAMRHYVYENASFPNALTGLVDENGDRHSTWHYDSSGRATATEEAGGAGAVTLAYNADRTVTATDALGAIRNFSFARHGDRNRVTAISGSQCPSCREPKATTYDQAGFVTSRTDYNDRITQYSNDDARGLEISRTEAFGTPRARTITTQWHPTYRLPTQIDEPGRRTTFVHDANGNVQSKTVLDTATGTARTWTYTHNSFGQVLTEDGPRTDVPDVTTYTYYSCTTGYQCGQVHTITNALNHITTFNTYNAHRQPLTIADPNGVVTTLTYDLRQRLTSRTVGTEQTTFEYWPTGLLKKVILPDNSFLSYIYDNAHRLTEIEDADGNRIVYALDAMGNRTAEQLYDPSNALTQTRTRVFNTLNQLWKEIGAAGTADVTTVYGYDNNGNQTGINAPLGRNTVQAYDELNRLTQITDPADRLVQYAYDAADNLVSVIDPRNLQTSYEYNGYGDLTREVSPDAGVTITTYDAARNIATTTDARNRVATYSHDAINRVIEVAYNDQTVSYTYDVGANALGRLSSLTDASGSTSWSYTTQGRVASKTQTMGGITKTIGYNYNSAGQLTSQTTPAGQLIGYEYANGRLSSIRLNGAVLVSDVLYVPFGPTRGWRWENGTSMVREYDQDQQLTDNNSGGFESYTYYPDGRIQTVTLEGPEGIGAPGAIALSPASTSNRLVSTTGTLSRNYTYDAAGHVIGDGTHTFTYNDAGRMVTANGAGGQTVYTYNALGQRVRKSNASETVYFVYDEAGHLLGEYGAAGELIQEIIWFDDIPVASIRLVGSGPGTGVFYIHTDHLNAPTKLSSPSTNAVVWRWDHDAYGNGAPNEDPDGNGLALRFNLRFPGQYFDAETGLHYNMARNYDPAIGRYVESDPIGLLGGINTYSYVDGNPISAIDAMGLCWSNTRAANHFFGGGGQAVSVQQIGCSSQIDSRVQPQRNIWKTRVENAARSKATSMKCGTSATISVTRSVGVSSGVFWIGGFSLLQDASCGIRTRCPLTGGAVCTPGMYWFDCSLGSRMHDLFVNPSDFDNSANSASPDFWDKWNYGGKPFYVDGSWADAVSGQGILP